MWKTVKLGDVCDLIGGGTPSKKNASFYGGDIPWATVRDMHSDELSKTEFAITTAGLENSSSKIIPAHNIVVASRVGLGKVCLLLQDTAINQDLRGVIPKQPSTIEARYLFYWFKSIAQEIVNAGRGATVHGVTLPYLKSLKFPLPPLAEQQRIVEKFDAAFVEIDRAVEITNERLVSSKQLFLKSLDSLVNDDVVGECSLLGDVCELAQGLAINKGTKHLLVEKSSKPLIRIKDLVNETEEQYITDDYENPKAEVNETDLVFTRTGSLGLVFRGRRGVLHNNSFKVTPIATLTSDYLYWWLKNPSFLGEIHRIGGKAAQPDISHKLFKAQQIKVPTPKEQTEIVTRIESIYEQSEQLDNINVAKLHQLISLKSAILAQELQPAQSEAA
jgi:type I restriction enzyme, S subunit